METPKQMDERVEDGIRRAAVGVVDIAHGYTCEFSATPEQHKRDYDVAEQVIKEQFASAGIVAVPVELLTDAAEEFEESIEIEGRKASMKEMARRLREAIRAAQGESTDG